LGRAVPRAARRLLVQHGAAGGHGPGPAARGPPDRRRGAAVGRPHHRRAQGPRHPRLPGAPAPPRCSHAATLCTPVAAPGMPARVACPWAARAAALAWHARLPGRSVVCWGQWGKQVRCGSRFRQTSCPYALCLLATGEDTNPHGAGCFFGGSLPMLVARCVNSVRCIRVCRACALSGPTWQSQCASGNVGAAWLCLLHACCRLQRPASFQRPRQALRLSGVSPCAAGHHLQDRRPAAAQGRDPLLVSARPPVPPRDPLVCTRRRAIAAASFVRAAANTCWDRHCQHQ